MQADESRQVVGRLAAEDSRTLAVVDTNLSIPVAVDELDELGRVLAAGIRSVDRVYYLAPAECCFGAL